MTHKPIQPTQLGTENELIALVNKIASFNYDNASPTESMALARALKVIADDVIERHAKVLSMQKRLEQQLAVVEVCGELAGVVTCLKDQPAQVTPAMHPVARSSRFSFLRLGSRG